MIVTIEVKPEVAHRWQRIAAREGRALEAVAAEAAEAGTETMESNGDARAHDAAREERKAKRLAALEAAVETARGFAVAPGALNAPLSDWALSRAGAYDAE